MSSRRLLGYLLATMGTATVAALVWFETDPEWVVAGCALLVVALLTAVWLIAQEIFLLQAMVLLGMTAFRISMHNFYHLNESLSGSIWAIALLALGVPLAFLVRGKSFPGLPRWAEVIARRPEQPMFFVPVILLAVLLLLKFSGFKMTMAWFGEGFVVFVLALWAKERSFRLTGLTLMMLCIVKLFYDTYFLKDLRTVAWIGIGLLILVISLLYGKYGRSRAALRDYL